MAIESKNHLKHLKQIKAAPWCKGGRLERQSRLHGEIGFTVSKVAVFGNPSVAGLLGHLQGRDKGAQSA